MSDESRTRVVPPVAQSDAARAGGDVISFIIGQLPSWLTSPKGFWTTLLVVLAAVRLLLHFGLIDFGYGSWLDDCSSAAIVFAAVVALALWVPASKPWIILTGILIGGWELIEVWSVGNFLKIGPWWANALYLAIAVVAVGVLILRQAQDDQAFEVASPQDAWGGLWLIALAVFAVWASSDLPGQRGFAFGPGTAPRLFAGLLLVLGITISAMGLLAKGPAIGGYAVRGPLMVTVAIVIFAWAIRPAGLVLSSFLAFMISATASEETRWLECTIVAAALTAFCVLLFVYLLNLPFQLCPQWTWAQQICRF
jgi:putative tricarboxylic transport membrane protein